MKGWFKDDLFRVVLKNAGKLGSTKLIGAVMGLVALVVTGRTLRPHDFGVLTLIASYIETIAAIGQFQSWQIVLHYAAVPWQKGERKTVQTSISLAMGLDICAGLLSMVFGMVAFLCLGKVLGVHDKPTLLILLYCTLIPGIGSTAAYGILRLFDRIDLVSRQQLITPAVRAVCCLLAWGSGMKLAGFVIAWYLALLAGQIYLWATALLELKRHDLLKGLRPSILKAARQMPKGMWGFVWTANITTLLETVWEPISKLLVGKIVSTSAAGLYSLAMEFLDAVQRPAKLLEKSYYPEVVLMDPRTSAPWKLALRTSVLSGALGMLAMLVVYIGGKPVISMFGHRFGDAATLMMWMSPALVFFTAGLPMEGVLYTAGRSHYIMLAQLVSVILYVPLLVYMGHHYGLNGAGLAYALGMFFATMTTFAIMGITYLRRNRIILPHEREIRQTDSLPASPGS
ncbi:lipopolysaccharide biosynthesis protein [Bombella apis]|uniref:Lipopolysaccharide biosynthesis protein n=2 Tax=Bombella apis TaxID=1785988 RepID=A0ABR9MR50_9PROT|nr:lipopolysaccharide biosynthesis protein [Bombella apis]MCL1563404.1 lipopolysaccharide biosynthesis protein [Parasaccharibacter sp. TMW 2.1886]MBE1724340.1 lipopolysaccharide biosynthesis protein [Bombella apis]MBR9729867.1 lipopolysaccharide biosynthesis protein [Bombella apis]MCT6820180.1 lipopolysaccharide biosynthesis protein [Bombella apis]MCT6845837.1 lipopolysaccharide biosynthesis protein [Bombella apis]